MYVDMRMCFEFVHMTTSYLLINLYLIFDLRFSVAVLKEDPEDLTHLAPTAGDVCVPLDENPIDYVLPDMLDDIMLSDCRLLSNDTDRDLSSSSPNSFFSYTRDDLEPSSRPLSPILTQVCKISIK